MHRLGEPAGELRHRVVRSLGGGNQPEPDLGLVVGEARLRDRGHVGQRVDARPRRRGERAQLACADMLENLRVIDQDRRHLSAQQRGHRGSVSGIRDVRDLDIGGTPEHLECDLLRGRGADARQRQCSRFRPRGVEHVRERVERRRCVDHDHLRGSHQIADRLEARERIKTQLLEAGIDDEGVGHDQQRASVRDRASDRLGADDRRRAGPILHHDGHASRLAYLIGQHPRERVGASARRKRDDDPDRLSGLAQGRVGKRHQEERRRRRDRRQERTPARPHSTIRKACYHPHLHRAVPDNTEDVSMERP